LTAHWGIEDPAEVEGTDIQKEAAFVAAFRYLKNRIVIFTSLPLGSIDKLSLGTRCAISAGARAPHSAKRRPDDAVFDLPRRLVAEALGNRVGWSRPWSGPASWPRASPRDVRWLCSATRFPPAQSWWFLIAILGPISGAHFNPRGYSDLCA